VVDGDEDGEAVQAEEPEEEEKENGQRNAVEMHQPWLPTLAEREERAVTHLPLRSW
jgi:hypothetical protein